MFEGRKCPACGRFGVKKCGTDYWKIWSCVYCGEVWDRDRLITGFDQVVEFYKEPAR